MCTMRTCTVALLFAVVEFGGITDGIAETLCRPSLTLSEVQFSAIRIPKLKRNWTAIVTANTSECAVNSGGFFDIVFTRLSENAPDLEFRQRFAWSPFSQNIALDFAADEAVAEYRSVGIDRQKIAPPSTALGGNHEMDHA